MHSKIKRRILRKEARKARAEHLVTKRKPLTELYVKRHPTEDRREWQKELQRHREEVYTDQEETKEGQESRIEYFRKKKEINNLQKKDAMQRLQSTWCCRQEPS